MNRPRLLQLCRFSDSFERHLHDSFDLIRWFEMPDQEQAAWLVRNAEAVVAIATGAQHGCSNALIESLPALKIIAVNGVGLDKVDVAFAESKNIRVTTTPGGPTDDTADLAVGLIISLLRRIPAADQFVRSGQWPHGEHLLARKVSGRRFGIVGLGQIGSAVAARLLPFGHVSYTGPNRKTVPYDFVTDLHALARASDVLLVTCPANPETSHMIDASVLDALGPEGWLINVARGAIVDEAALIAALEAGRIAGAGLDVFENEPHVPESLRNNPNVILIPHMGSATVETRQRMEEMVIENLSSIL